MHPHPTTTANSGAAEDDGQGGGRRRRADKRRRRAGGDDADDDSDAEWRRSDGDGECGEDGDSDEEGGIVGVGIVGDTDWRERAARARMEQRRRVARERQLGGSATT